METDSTPTKSFGRLVRGTRSISVGSSRGDVSRFSLKFFFWFTHAGIDGVRKEQNRRLPYLMGNGIPMPSDGILGASTTKREMGKEPQFHALNIRSPMGMVPETGTQRSFRQQQTPQNRCPARTANKSSATSQNSYPVSDGQGNTKNGLRWAC